MQNKSIKNATSCGRYSYASLAQGKVNECQQQHPTLVVTAPACPPFPFSNLFLHFLSAGSQVLRNFPSWQMSTGSGGLLRVERLAEDWRRVGDANVPECSLSCRRFSTILRSSGVWQWREQ